MIFLAPYGYDRMYDGKPRAGVPTERLGSKARCDALVKTKKHLQWLAWKEVTCFWVLVAGFSKESPYKATAKAPTSLVEDMSKYLASLGYNSYLGTPCAWGTYEETQKIIGTITKNKSHNPPNVYVSTNPGHLPRVWLCWLFLKPKDWKLHFVPAQHSFTPKEWAQETIKFAIYLYRFLFRKW